MISRHVEILNTLMRLTCPKNEENRLILALDECRMIFRIIHSIGTLNP